MSWDAHLPEFQFATGDMAARIGIVALDPEEVGAHERLMSWQTPLLDWFVTIPSTCEYLYGFGDRWRHIVMFEARRPAVAGERYPRCTGGERRWPPEDVGGSTGYVDFLEGLADRRHERHKGIRAADRRLLRSRGAPLGNGAFLQAWGSLASPS
jgi:hypothetical protein